MNELIIPQLGCNPNTGSIQLDGLQAMLDAVAHLFLIAIDCSAVYMSVSSLESNGNCLGGIGFVEIPSSKAQGGDGRDGRD